MSDATVIVGAVHVMDESHTLAEAVAFEGGVITAVGAREHVERSVRPGARWIETRAAVLPGFVDPHHHASLAALWGGLVRLTPPRVTDIASLQSALAEHVAQVPPGEWLMATEWDEMLLAERRPPTRQELDEAAPDHPLLAMHYTCHRAVANSRALELAGIERSTPEPSGGAIERGAGGLPTGLLIERGMSRCESLARASLLTHDVDGFVARLAEHHDALLAAGITAIVDPTVPRDTATVCAEAARRGAVKVPTTIMPVSVTGYLEEPWDALDGPVTGESIGALRVGPVKLVFDGAPGCAMCLGWWQTFGATMSTWALALRLRSLDPIRASLSLAPRLGKEIRTGIQIYRREQAHEVISGVVERGFGVATHAIGNEAIDIALEAYEAQGAALHGRHRARLEHAMLLDQGLVARIADVGAVVVGQPHMLSLPSFASAPSIPGIRSFPYRWLLDAGVTVAGSSDYPVAGFDPLDGVRSAVTRKTSRGSTYEPDQRITLDEALAAYTRVAAEAAGLEREAGTLEVGKRADLVVLDGSLEAARLSELRVRATYVGGELRHGAPVT